MLAPKGAVVQVSKTAFPRPLGVNGIAASLQGRVFTFLGVGLSIPFFFFILIGSTLNLTMSKTFVKVHTFSVNEEDIQMFEQLQPNT